MKRLVLALTLAATTITGLRPAMAGDYYPNNYGYPYSQAPCAPQPYPAQQSAPILQKLIIGGILVGVGFAAGRLTAPRPQPYGYGSQPYGYAPQPYAAYGYHPHGHWGR